MFTLFVASPQSAKAQCPMCKAAVVSNSGYGEEENAMASGLNTGIFYLFALPYLALMGVGFLFYRGYRRRKRREAAAEMTTIEDVIGGTPNATSSP